MYFDNCNLTNFNKYIIIIFFVHTCQVGDHIEKIDGTSVVGCRHFEVAKMLKGIQKGTTFVLRVVEPLKAGFGK